MIFHRRLIVLFLLGLLPLSTSARPRSTSAAASSIWGTNGPVNAAVLER